MCITINVYCHKSAYIEHRITSELWSNRRELSRPLNGEDSILIFYRSFTANSNDCSWRAPW